MVVKPCIVCGALSPRSRCPRHERPANRFSPTAYTRDYARHDREARAAKKAHPWCSICGSTEKLDLHHDSELGPIVVCNWHHCQLDPHARPR